MIARLLISPSLDSRVEKIEKILSDAKINKKHPDLLYFPSDTKLGIEQTRKIKEHLSLKPYQAKGRIIVLEDASVLTHEAQNAILKTLEELPKEALIILGTSSDAKLLPTILSRCQMVRINSSKLIVNNSKYGKDIEQLIGADISERFEYVEKLKNREEFLHALVSYFHQNLRLHPKGVKLSFIKDLIQAEEWADQNVNIRAILEYLMLVMPGKV